MGFALPVVKLLWLKGSFFSIDQRTVSRMLVNMNIQIISDKYLRMMREAACYYPADIASLIEGW
jgi:hypothetical protein